MSDRLEAAASGRARCRACGTKIEKGALRFGEELATGYGDQEASSVYWFHPRCAAHRRPEKIAPLLHDGSAAGALADRLTLLAEAELGLAHPRLLRIAGAERAPSGRARCRECKALIADGTWRIRLSSFGENGFFDPLGYIHAACHQAYFGVSDIGDRLRVASPDLDAVALDEILAQELGDGPQPERS